MNRLWRLTNTLCLVCALCLGACSDDDIKDAAKESIQIFSTGK